jgi:F-type H+-transporting ATPase subunit gamma
MSETSEGLRHKIEGAVELGSVVRTMKALAASSIAQYERAVSSLDEYYRTVELGLVACLHQNEGALGQAHKVLAPSHAFPHPNPASRLTAGCAKPADSYGGKHAFRNPVFVPEGEGTRVPSPQSSGETTSQSTKPASGQVAGYPEGRGSERKNHLSIPERSREFDVNATVAVVFGSDQGLVGQYNEVLADFVVNELAGMAGSKRILVVGERIQGHLSDASLRVQAGFSVPNGIAAITQLTGRVLIEIEALHGEVEQVYLFHNRPSGSLYHSVMQRLLPLDVAWRRALTHLPWPDKNLPEVMGGNETTLQALIREYLFISLFRACAEALASEHASRLAAMRRAEKNIDELLADLNQDFHRLRQTAIDEELFDVIAGYELLSTGGEISHADRTGENSGLLSTQAT